MIETSTRFCNLKVFVLEQKLQPATPFYLAYSWKNHLVFNKELYQRDLKFYIFTIKVAQQSLHFHFESPSVVVRVHKNILILCTWIVYGKSQLNELLYGQRSTINLEAFNVEIYKTLGIVKCPWISDRIFVFHIVRQMRNLWWYQHALSSFESFFFCFIFHLVFIISPLCQPTTYKLPPNYGNWATLPLARLL